MVRIRMSRLGRRHRPFYRINAVDQRNKRDGRFIENLGWFDPVATDPEKQLKLYDERIKHWLSVGAQPSETVTDILIKANLMDGAKRKAQIAARIKAREVPAAPAAADAPAGDGAEAAASE
ncbi:MAG: 30S ribosomal protein S16 [Phycisphaerales bacterium]|nr:MAG: 30S ribosomal protein S16 [Phycisphaerales bacterium]